MSLSKTLKLFNPSSTSSTSTYGSLFCAGTMVSFLQEPGTVFPPYSICVAFCFEYILSIYMKYMDECVNQNVNLVLISQHSNYLQLSLTDFSHSSPLSISYFLCPTTGQLGSCTLEEKKLAYAWALGSSVGAQGVREGLGNDVFTSEHEHLHEMQIYFSMTNMYICMR